MNFSVGDSRWWTLAWCLLLDRSLSMMMCGDYEVARKCAFDVARQIPAPFGGFVPVVAFAEHAERVSPGDVADLPYAMTYGANLAAAVQVAQQQMGGKRGRLVIFSHFEPTCFTPPAKRRSGSQPIFSFPPTPEAVHATVEAVVLAGVMGLVIDAFCFDNKPPPSTAEVLSAVAAAGGEILYVSEDDCPGIVEDYLRAKWME